MNPKSQKSDLTANISREDHNITVGAGLPRPYNVVNAIENCCKQNIRLETLIHALGSQMLEESNRGKTGYSKYLCIHQMFEALLERSPDTVAVMVGLRGILKTGGTYV